MPLSRRLTSRRSTNRIPHSLTVKNAINRGSELTMTLNGRTYSYRRRSRLMGGDWSARFNVSGTEGQLKSFFLTKIGHHVEQNAGAAKLWEGFIYEMDYSAQGVTRRISLADVRNAVKAKYTNQNGTNQETSWYTDDESIAIYGRIEEIIYLDGVIAATAEAEAQTYLTQTAWPAPAMVAAGTGDDLELQVTAVGYAYTLNFRFVTAGDGTTQNLSTFLEDIIDTDCDFVTKADIDSNTTQVRTEFDVDMRAWDALVALTEIGDATQPFIIEVVQGQRLNYKALNPKPTLFWRGRSLHTAAGTNLSMNPWIVRPGILRDLTWTRQEASSNTFLDDLTDSVVAEVEASDELEIPILKTDRYDDSDFMTALARELRADEEGLSGNFMVRPMTRFL